MQHSPYHSSSYLVNINPRGSPIILDDAVAFKRKIPLRNGFFAVYGFVHTFEIRFGRDMPFFTEPLRRLLF